MFSLKSARNCSIFIKKSFQCNKYSHYTMLRLPKSVTNTADTQFIDDSHFSAEKILVVPRARALSVCKCFSKRNIVYADWKLARVLVRSCACSCARARARKRQKSLQRNENHWHIEYQINFNGSSLCKGSKSTKCKFFQNFDFSLCKLLHKLCPPFSHKRVVGIF